MGNINVVIIDDEENLISSITRLLEEYCPSTKVIGTAGNVEDAIDCIHKKRPDIVFMDVKMPGGGGFSILNRVENKNFELVFVTAYDDFALKAFEFSALNYILKPVNYLDLVKTVERYINRKSYNMIEQKLDVLSQNLRSRQKRILLPSQNELNVVDVDGIKYCESSSNYTIVYHKKRKYVVSKSLNYFENILVGMDFFRIHSRYLVNLSEIDCYVKGRCGYIVMRDGKELDVSARKKQLFIESLTDFYASTNSGYH